MKCSVIIPYHQRKPLLLNTLLTLNEQQEVNHLDFEVIIIDDGSTDLDENSISRLGLKINTCYYKYPRNEHSCSAFARNRGIEKARGKYLIFLDCDQIVSPYFIKEHLYFLEHPYSRDTILQFGSRKNLQENVSFDNSLRLFAKACFSFSQLGRIHLRCFFKEGINGVGLLFCFGLVRVKEHASSCFRQDF